jgi:Reverse transcriptase (RNA-dependent DNA polymerase)
VRKISALLDEYADIFRLKLSEAPAACFPPLKVELKPNSVPVQQRLRRYAPRQASFLSSYVLQLEKRGYIRKTHTARWIAAPNVVPKPGPARFRLTIDSRPINQATIPIVWPMPHLDSALASLRGARFFAKIDLSAGYYQIAIDPSCQELFSFITPRGVFAPTRLLQGSRNAAAYFQMCIHTAIAELHDSVLQWLDDLLFHAASEQALIAVLHSFFTICRKTGLFLHAGKCELFTRETTFCGRHLSADGIVFDPRRMDALRSMSLPTTGAELQQFLCALGWMRRAIPNFARRTQLLQAILEEVYSTAGGRIRRHASRVPLVSTAWGPPSYFCFSRITKTSSHSTVPLRC